MAASKTKSNITRAEQDDLPSPLTSHVEYAQATAKLAELREQLAACNVRLSAGPCPMPDDLKMRALARLDGEQSGAVAAAKQRGQDLADAPVLKEAIRLQEERVGDLTNSLTREAWDGKARGRDWTLIDDVLAGLDDVVEAIVAVNAHRAEMKALGYRATSAGLADVSQIERVIQNLKPTLETVERLR